MSDPFQTAVELVHDALLRRRECGADLRASAASLTRLLTTPAGPPERKVSLPPETSPEPAAMSGAAAVVSGPGARPAAGETSAPAGAENASSPRRTAGGSNRPDAPGAAPQGASFSEMPDRTVDPHPPLSTAEKIARLEALAARVSPCVRCPHLARSRTQTVFGVGNPDAELMFIGEAPGADEDLRGEPFVGRAGQLLTKIIETMGFARSDVFIANVLKCRPDMPPGSTGNRRPTAKEMETCLPYLVEQIEIIQPRAIVALGAVAMEGLLGRVEPMRNLRGKWHAFQRIPVMATYHPAYLLRNQSQSEKRKVWEDMLLVLERLGKTITPRQQNYFLSKS